MTRPTKRPRCSSSPSEPSERQNQRVSSLSPLSSPDSDGEDYLVRLCRSIRSGLSNGGPSRTKATRPAPAVKSEPSRPTELPIELRHFESNPDAAVVLVLRRRNWFPARLVGYTPVKTVEEHEARKKDEWAVILHPSEQSTGEEAVTRVGAKSIMYLSDPRVATCAFPTLQAQEGKVQPSDARTRADTPPSVDENASINHDAFRELDRIAQLYKLRPHFTRLVNEMYPPGQWRIDAFFNNPKDPHLTTKQLRGDITEAEMVEVLIPELERWARKRVSRGEDGAAGKGEERGNKREDRKGNGRSTDDDDNNAEHGISVDRPTAAEMPTPRFDTSTQANRKLYVERVLRPEAIIALCLGSISPSDLISSELDRRLQSSRRLALGEDEDEDGDGDEDDRPSAADQDALVAPNKASLSNKVKGKGKGKGKGGRSHTPLEPSLSDYAPKPHRQPPKIKQIPTSLLTALSLELTSNTDTASTTIPEWLLYSLAVAELKTLNRNNKNEYWLGAVDRCRRARSNLRAQQGLPDENLTSVDREDEAIRRKGLVQMFKDTRAVKRVADWRK